MAISDEEADEWFRVLKTDSLSLVLHVFELLLRPAPIILFHPITKLATEKFLIKLHFCVQNYLF